MLIRGAQEDGWPAVHRFFTAIVGEGRSYAFPEGLSLEQARGWWMETPTGRTVAVRLWGSLGFEVLATVPEAFGHPEHGLVGLHLMFLDLTPSWLRQGAAGWGRGGARGQAS